MDKPDQNLEQMLFDGLNEHGFLFQEKCAEILKNNQGLTDWLLLTQEYPVSTRVKDARIDIVLKDVKSYAFPREIYAIVECKRANLSYTYAWLFGNPLLTNFDQPLAINLREEETNKSGRHVGKHIRYAQIKLHYPQVNTYLIDNWWLEIGIGKKKASPQPIEDAFTQVCIGVSGIAQEQEMQYRKEPGPLSAIFIPILITNVPLYVATYNLDDVDLTSGAINSKNIFFGPAGQKPEEIGWLLVDYGVSRSVTPDGLYEYATGTSPVDLEEYHKRSIFVVNSKNIVNFFSRLH
jgi:hypothetical protein